MARKSYKTGQRALKRKIAIRRPRKTLLVFCEGRRTEPEYLEALKRQPFVRDVAAVDLRVETTHGVPLTLVSMAVDARIKAKNEDAEMDEFWCVFDIEWPTNHPNLKDAISQAQQHDIQLAISNPCFELWLVLHFRDHGGWLDNSQACRLRRQLDGSGGKGIDAAQYMPRIKDAVRRAAELDGRHRQDDTLFPNNNPSSGMYRLLSTIEPPER
jgi:hypothetical protein